jgi:hypothetical protein
MSGARRSARRKAVKLIRRRFGGTRCTWQRAVLLNQQSLAKSIVKLPPLRPPLLFTPIALMQHRRTPATQNCHCVLTPADIPYCPTQYSFSSFPIPLLTPPIGLPHAAFHSSDIRVTRRIRDFQGYICRYIHTPSCLQPDLKSLDFKCGCTKLLLARPFWADLITTAELIHIAYMIIHILNDIHILSNTSYPS